MGLFDDLLEEDELTQQPVQPQSQRRKGGLFDDLLEEEDLIQDTRPQVGQPAATEEEEFSYFKPIIEQEEIKPKAEDQGILRQVADIPLGIARGGVSGIKMMTDILGADNPVSKSLAGVEGYMADLMSAQAKEDQQEISRIMKDAEDKGFGEQVKAGIKAFSIAPVDIMSQALGTMAPVIATGLVGSAAKLGALGVRGLQLGIGAGMGAGETKGEIYNEVKNELVNSGIAEDAAEKAAVEAQSYGGKNLDLILMNAGLGAASTLGAEGIITRILTKQGTAPAAGIVSRVLKGGLSEAGPEAGQEAGIQLSKNVALQREGFDVDPSRGVVASATMGAIAGAPLGGIAGAVERPAPIKTLAEENLEQTNEIARKVAENGAPLTASAIQDQAAANLRQDELAKQLEAQLEEELVAVKEPTAAPPAIQSKEEFAAIYSQVAPEELDAAEAGFTEQAATAETEEGRINAQNALEAIKEVKATVTPTALTVEPTITQAVTPAVPTAQPPITDATQEIIQPEGVREEPQDRVEVRPPEEAGVGDSLLGAARGQEEGQVAPPAPAIPEAITRAIEERRPISAPFALQYGVDLPSGWRYEDDFFVPPAAPEPTISEIPRTSELVGEQSVQPTIREVPEISQIVGAEPAAIVEQEPSKVYDETQTRIRGIQAPPAGGEIVLEPEPLAIQGGITKQEKQVGRGAGDREKQRGDAGVAGQALPRTIPELTEDQAETLRDFISLRKSQGREPNPEHVKRLAEYDARNAGVEVQQGDIVSNIVVGHPLFEAPQPELQNLVPIKVQNKEQLASSIQRTENVRNAAQTYIGQYQAEQAKAKTAAQKKAFAKKFSKSEFDRQRDILDYINNDVMPELDRMEKAAPTPAPTPVTTPPVTEAVTPAPAPEAVPAGIVVGNRIKLGKSPQTYTIEEVIPQSATERELGEQYYSVKNERTGEMQTVEAGDLRQVKGKGARKIAADSQAIDTTPEGILITPPDQRYTFNEVFDVAYDMFGGEIPEGFAIVNDSTNKDFEFKAAYVPESGEIIVNLAYLNKNDDIRDTITHELGHYIYGDPEFRAAFDQFIASLSPEARAELDAYVDTAYNKETGEIRLEEKMVRAFVDQFINEEQAPMWRSMLDAIKRFLNKLGFKFNISDRDAISVFTAALDRYKAGEAISREGGARKIIDDLTAMDAEYLAAVERGDMETAQRMVDDAAKKAGYTIAAGHATPFNFNVFDRAKISDADPDTIIRGFFFSTEPRPSASYVSGLVDRGERGDVKIINAYLKPGITVKRSDANRTVRQQLKNDPEYQEQGYSTDLDLYFPKNADTVEFVSGWKLTSEKKRKFEQTGEIKEGNAVLIRSEDGGVDMYREADDYGPREFITGYLDLSDAYSQHSESQYIVKDSNQIKSADPVTYDDAGDVIPLSQRFRPTSPDIRRMAAEPAPKRRKEQVAGMEREEARYITTPEGIIKQTNDVLREKFFDGTTVSPEKTTEAWGYISRLLDIKSGAANELAGQINDVVDKETNSKARMGASLFSVSLANYAAKLAAQGDSKMLKFMIRNVNSMPVDKYAGGKSDAGKALRAAREYDIDGYGAIKIEVKAKIERTAATLFGTGSPTEAQFKAVEGAIKESDAQELGNPEEVAQEVDKVEKRTKRKITDKIEKIIGKGSLKGIIQAIKETPLEKQQDAGWIEKVVNDFLVNAGLSPEVAATASKLYESLIAERLAAARQKAFEDNLNKSAPWKDYLARNSRLAKDALKKIQEAIRTGALDPEQNVESIIAAESGWSGFTKDQYQKIVQLDSVINDPKQDDVTRREAMADLNKVISDAKLPVRFKDALGAYYVGNALMGIPTLTVNIASPIGFTIRNLMTDVSKFAFTDPARIPVAFETFMESMRSWYDQTSYAFKNQIYLNDVVEYLQGQNVLRELFDKGKKQWAQGKYAEGFVNMAVGMTQITGRVLSSLDQGAISMLENQNITRYALEALANTKGKVPKDKLKEFANMVIDTRRKTIAQSIANGMPRDRAGVLADLAVKSEVISALSQYDINPMNVLDASINDALQSVGRNKTLTIKGVEESQQRISDSGFLSYLPIKMLEDVAQASGREGSAMQIFAKMLYGFALVPARVFHNVAWFSPYGFIRLGIDKYKKNKGEDSPYAMSLQTDAQYKQRLTETIAGSISMLGLAALSSASSDEDDDKKFKIVITGNGPSATTDKQYFDSWMKKWKPYSVHIVVNGNIIPINIGRGGEALFFPIMLAGALDDFRIKQKQNLTKKEPEDLSAIAQMLGSSFFALAQRGPYAAFTKPLFDASKEGRVTEELASQAGFFGKTFIPVIGSSLARNISDLLNDPVDRSSIEGAIYANTPVVGPWLGTKALNALGQPIRADDWGDRLFKLGVPVVFSFPKDTPMNELNELILKQGSGPTIPTRANAQKRFGDILTDKEFETYVREYGRVMSDKMFKNRKKLESMKASDYDDELEKYARGYSIDGIKIKGASDSAVLAVKRMRQ